MQEVSGGSAAGKEGKLIEAALLKPLLWQQDLVPSGRHPRMAHHRWELGRSPAGSPSLPACAGFQGFGECPGAGKWRAACTAPSRWMLSARTACPPQLRLLLEGLHEGHEQHLLWCRGLTALTKPGSHEGKAEQSGLALHGECWPGEVPAAHSWLPFSVGLRSPPGAGLTGAEMDSRFSSPPPPLPTSQQERDTGEPG